MSSSLAPQTEYVQPPDAALSPSRAHCDPRASVVARMTTVCELADC